MQRKVLLIIVICIVVIIGIIVTYLPLFNRTRYISSMEEQAGYLIKKVEAYRKKHHKLPRYQDDMNLNLPDNYPFYYILERDSSNYMVSFQIAPFRSMIYYSENKQWESQ